jgi:cytochrome b-561
MSYHTVPGTHETQKTIHMTLHFIAIVLGIVGICAVFKFHDMVNLVDVYSLHSWIGLGTFCLFGLQVYKILSQQHMNSTKKYEHMKKIKLHRH